MNLRRRSFLISLVVPCLLSFPAASASNQTEKALRAATDYYRKGAKALQSGNNAQARDFLTKAVNTLADFPEANLLLGNMAIQEKRYELALEHYESARRGYSTLGDVLFDLRMERYRDTQEEIRNYRDQLVVLRDPKVKVGNRETEIVKIEELIRKLGLVRPPSPEEAKEPPGEILFYVGNAQFYLGRVAEAVVEWEGCARKSPDFPLVHNNLAIGYLKLGRAQDAANSLARAEQLGVQIHPGLRRDIEQAVANAGNAG